MKNKVMKWLDSKLIAWNCYVTDNNKGMGTVEIILIIVVLIAVVALFKTKILELVETIFDTIDANAGDI